MDILPPRKRVPPRPTLPLQHQPTAPGREELQLPNTDRTANYQAAPQAFQFQNSPAATPQQAQKKTSRPPRKRRKIWAILSVFVFVPLLCFAAAFGWYTWSLQPRTSGTENPTEYRLVVEEGATLREITDKLQHEKIVRSAFVMEVYGRLHPAEAVVHTGRYIVRSNMSVSAIMQHVSSGKSDEYDLTILPGKTLAELHDTFRQFGFSDEEITAAYKQVYDANLLAERPAGQGLEGYLYPETYRMQSNSTLPQLFNRAFTTLYNKMSSDGTLDAFKAQNLTLHQGLTLASIVQMEVGNPDDQKQVAQVFLKRLHDGMALGSDVTFFYAAKQMGVPPSAELDSPYNTRKNTGLPPGPIANMNYSAIEAVAHPAAGDYVYFVAGDDGKTYFAHTYEEHQANVAAHCKTLCN